MEWRLRSFNRVVILGEGLAHIGSRTVGEHGSFAALRHHRFGEDASHSLNDRRHRLQPKIGLDNQRNR